MSIIYPFNIPFSISTFFWVLFPSSSIFNDPHAFGIVPSSIAVTLVDAICSPNLFAKTEFPLATAVASKAWPHASWNITPPKPLSIATVIFPAGQFFAWSIVWAIRAASFPWYAGSILSNISIPIHLPGPSNPVWFSSPFEAIALTPNLVLTLLSSIYNPSLFAINIFCSLSA